MRRGNSSKTDRVGARHRDTVVEEQLNSLFREHYTTRLRRRRTH